MAKSDAIPTCLPAPGLGLRGPRQKLAARLVAIFLGVGCGVLLGPTGGLVSPETAVLVGNWLAFPGKLFLLAIQFVVVPLIVASVIRGIAAEGPAGGMGAIGARTVAFFVATTLVAVVIGIGTAMLAQSGLYIDRLLVHTALAAPGGAGAAGPRRCPRPPTSRTSSSACFPGTLSPRLSAATCSRSSSPPPSSVSLWP